MPISTDLNIPPYNDTYSANNDYYRTGFKPGVSIQARELNELQSQFASQIERFGDNVFKTGSIVSGCNFVFLNPYPYIKLEDQTIDGTTASPSSYANLTIKNVTTGLRAQVVGSADGFVSTDPDLKTLYLKYLNTGFDANTPTFSSGDALTVFDAIRNGIESVTVTSGGQGFSNSDQAFAVSALAITMSTGTLSNGQYIVNGLGANVKIIGIDSATLANSGQIILSVAPREVDLANVSVNSTAWSMSNGQSFTNSGNTASGTISGVIGSGYSGLVLTDALGTITRILNLNKGVGYTTLPFITLRSANNESGYSSLDLDAQNYVAKVRVAAVANAVGSGYAMGVNEGITYLKGMFLRVAPQTVVVSKYDTEPDGVSVCFTAAETIVTSDIDPNLEDPAAGKNNGAPGADRLKVVPQLTVVDSAGVSTNSEVIALVEFNDGNPYIQREQSQYSSVGDAIAETVIDQSGDFFIDPFLVTTATPTEATANNLAYGVDVVVDPGSAYIQGYKIQTHSNFVMRTPLQADTALTPYTVSLNYGNYVKVKELGGTFQFNTGELVSLYSTAKGYISNSTLVETSNTTPQGTLLGTARIRNLQLATGTPGTNSAIYNLYVFDVRMLTGKNFGSVRSVYYDGTKKGIADVVTTLDASGTAVCSITEGSSSTLVFPTGFNSLKNVNAASYEFTSLDQTLSIANSGVLTKSLASAGQTFPWFGATLTSDQKNQLYLAPTSIDLVSSTNVTGTWVSNTSTANGVANTGTTAATDLVAGDWVTLLGNSTQIDLKQVVSVVNNTFIQFDSAPSFANTAAVMARTWPKNIPINLSRSGVSANVSANGTVLSVNVGFPIASAIANPVVISAPVLTSNATPVTKTVNRNAFIKVCVANNESNTVGPWCLGVPDVFRLRGVYVGNSTVNTTSTNYVSMFAVDNNQKTDYLDLSWLYLENKAVSPIGSGSYILVNFDYYTTTGSGFYATPSYTHSTNTNQVMINDSTPYDSLGSVASTWEVPEFFTESGYEVDLLQCVDLRPYAANTVTPAANASSAPINPNSAVTFSSTEKMFPVPGSNFAANVEYYLPRLDGIFVDKKGKIYTVQGEPLLSTGTSVKTPPGSMKIADVLYPPYPQLPATKSTSLVSMINTGLLNDSKYNTSRVRSHSISLLSSMLTTSPKVYTNQDLASMDQRLKNVEYYVNLSQLETGLSTMIIPSSSDPTVNRYQFGFFADAFETTTLSDLANPTYAAIRENGDVVPTKMTWEVYLGDDYSGAMPYVVQNLIGQNNATIGDINDPTSEPRCAVSMANTVAYQLVYRNAYDYNHQIPQDGSVDLVTLTLADAEHMAASGPIASTGVDSASTENLGSATVTLFFYAYDHPVQFQILQGNTVVADSSTAVALSATDVNNLTTGSNMNQWFNDQTGLYLKNPVNTTGAYVKYAGKVTWNYAGSGDNHVSVRTTNGAGVRNWRWVLSYPINGDTAGCVPPPPDHSCPDGYTYDSITGGCIIIIDPPIDPPPIPINFTGCGNSAEVWAMQILRMRAAGTNIGTITINLGLGAVTGTLSDWLNPISAQNIELLREGLHAMLTTEGQMDAWNSRQIDGVFGSFASLLGTGGFYGISDAGTDAGMIYYQSHTGVRTTLFRLPVSPDVPSFSLPS